jgi:sec-independent protein translocase protein TatA
MHGFASPEPLMLAFWTPSGWELIVILVIGLLLFGRRLPEVGRSLGRSIVEFKKGVQGVEDEVKASTSEAGGSAPRVAKPAIEGSGDPRRVSTSDRVEEHA